MRSRGSSLDTVTYVHGFVLAYASAGGLRVWLSLSSSVFASHSI